MTLTSTEARTGAVRRDDLAMSSAADVAAACAAAAAAAPGWERAGRAGRADALEAVAAALESRADDIIAVADAETALGAPRLTGELKRTCFQLRFFAEVLREGSYVEAIIDHADDSPMGPRPDLRRMLLPLGPVAVFGASNFPLAFSVPGGDTVSALAAGCPVVVKAHEAHLETSLLCATVMQEALGEPHRGVLSLVIGREAGTTLVEDPRVRAVGFTGSTAGGRALADLAAARAEPIPFYGELGSVNAFIATPAAVRERAAEIGAGLADSFTLGAGQFCTKPGLALVPTGEDGDRLMAACREAVAGRSFTMLTDGIRAAYAAVTGDAGAGHDERTVRPHVVQVDAAELADRPELLDEVFGPYLVAVRYADQAALQDALALLPGALTVTVHGEPGDEVGAALVRDLPARVGRIVWNGYPTGVSVGWAQHHGGPWPGTNTVHTSVGATAIRRFLRPLAWQSTPADLLPEELRDGPDPVPRRVDGELRLPAPTTDPASEE